MVKLYNNEIYSLLKFSLVLLCCAALLISNVAFAKTVYDKQPAITDAELINFIEVLPRFRAWAASHNEHASPSIKNGQADFNYSKAAAAWVKNNGWDPARFFSVMGRAAAALFIVAEGGGVPQNTPSDMPDVSEVELKLVRKHLTKLLQAGKDVPPIGQ